MLGSTAALRNARKGPAWEEWERPGTRLPNRVASECTLAALRVCLGGGRDRARKLSQHAASTWLATTARVGRPSSDIRATDKNRVRVARRRTPHAWFCQQLQQVNMLNAKKVQLNKFSR